MINQGEVIYGIAISSNSLLLAIFILSGFLLLAVLVSTMRIYKKAGKPAISAIIPIWSQIVLFQIVGKPVWYIFLLMIPIVNIVVLFQAYILLAKKFGKGSGFGIGMIFLPMIFIPLLSFYDYVDESKVQEEPIYNPFNQTNVEQVMPSAPVPENVEVQATNEVSLDTVSPDAVTPMEPLAPEMQVSEPVQEVVSEIASNEVIESVNPVNNNEDLQLGDMAFEEPAIPIVEPVVNEVQNEALSQTVEPNVLEEPVLVGQNPSVQDIQNILNVKPVDEPKDIAFGVVPQVEPVIEEVVSTESADNNLDTLTLEETVISEPVVNSEEVIEMPEIAAKSCPACGVSLAEDVKFCTSCGTQL